MRRWLNIKVWLHSNISIYMLHIHIIIIVISVNQIYNKLEPWWRDLFSVLNFWHWSISWFVYETYKTANCRMNHMNFMWKNDWSFLVGFPWHWAEQNGFALGLFLGTRRDSWAPLHSHMDISSRQQLSFSLMLHYGVFSPKFSNLLQFPEDTLQYKHHSSKEC